MPKAHARLSPSAAARWINCPGSIALAEKCPPPAPSAYADEGTLAHSIAELKLQKERGAVTTRSYSGKMATLKAVDYFSEEMEEATDFYRDAVMERLAAAGPDAVLMVEQRFSLDEWIPECFGTSDAVIIAGSTIEVIDLKYGKGVRVDAVGNPQLRLYGLGAAGLFGDIYDLDTVRMTIIQPRLDHINTDEIPLEELRSWAWGTVWPAAQAAIDGSGKTACGDWCRFCPAKATCRTRAEYNLELARHEFKQPDLLTPEEIGEVLRRADQLEAWAKDVQGYALQQALAGEHFEGWKLVEGKSVRRYADDLKVADTLKGAGFDEAVLYERKLYGITAMEKIVGKKKLTEILGDLIVKPAGKPVLVPESDKRQAISTAGQAAEDFKNG